MGDHSKSWVLAVKFENTAIQYRKHQNNRHYSTLKMLKNILNRSKFHLSVSKACFPYFPFSRTISELEVLSRKFLMVYFPIIFLMFLSLKHKKLLYITYALFIICLDFFFLLNKQPNFCFLTAPTFLSLRGFFPGWCECGYSVLRQPCECYSQFNRGKKFSFLLQDQLPPLYEV